MISKRTKFNLLQLASRWNCSNPAVVAVVIVAVNKNNEVLSKVYALKYVHSSSTLCVLLSSTLRYVWYVKWNFYWVIRTVIGFVVRTKGITIE